MNGIVGAVNYNVPFRSQSVMKGIYIKVDEPRRINNVMIGNTYYPDDQDSLVNQVLEHENFAIVLCGRITNYHQLIVKYNFDSEDVLSILLQLFELKGIKMLQELTGVFAFAIYDRNNRRLFLVRDKSEHRPLYLYDSNGNFVFSSDLNMLVRLTKTKVDFKSLARCLYLGDNYKKSTPYDSIIEIEKGHCIIIDTLTGMFENVCWHSCSKQTSESDPILYN